MPGSLGAIAAGESACAAPAQRIAPTTRSRLKVRIAASRFPVRFRERPHGGLDRRRAGGGW
jgi:hypothetical protein